MAEPPTDHRTRDVPWANIVGFVRQLSHDLRNHLNAAELQSAYIGELVETQELKDEVKRLREMIGEAARALQQVSVAMAPVKPTTMAYRAADFIEDVRQKTDSAKTSWEVAVGDAMLEIDPQLLQQAFVELFDNATRYRSGEGELSAKAQVRDGLFVFILEEPKKGFQQAIENWMEQPLRAVGRGHYGLGLNRVRAIVEAHGGEIAAHYDGAASLLLTRLSLPVAKEKA